MRDPIGSLDAQQNIPQLGYRPLHIIVDDNMPEFVLRRKLYPSGF